MLHVATPTAQSAAPAPTWDGLIAELAAVPGLERVVDLARQRQAAGADVVDFADEALKAFDRARLSDGLGEVFEMARGIGWNMGQDEVEIAMDHLKAGAEPQAALDAAKASRDHDPNAFASLVEARRVAMAEEEATDREFDARYEAFLQLAPPPPPELVALDISTIEGLSAAELPLEEKAALLPILKDWLAARETAKGECGFAEARRLVEAAVDRSAAIEAAILTSVPADLCGLALQHQLAIEFWDVTSAGGLWKALHDEDEGAAKLAQLYVNVLRMIGGEHPQLSALDFDPEVFCRLWWAFPGHSFGAARTGPIYDEAAGAWPKNRATEAEVTLTPAQASEYERTAQRLFGARPSRADVSRGAVISASSAEILHAMELDDGERNRLLKAAASRVVGPIGRPLWEALEEWQRDAVLDWIADEYRDLYEVQISDRIRRTRVTPEPRIEAHEAAIAWVVAWMTAGGRLDGQEGKVVAGRPCGDLPAGRETALSDGLAALDATNGLRDAVRALCKSAGIVR